LIVDQKRVAGVATLDLERADSEAETLVLDAVGFEINSVNLVVNDEIRKVKWNYDGDRLHVAVPTELELFSVEVDYAVTPRRGLYFLEPDSVVTDRPRQVWSQCQDQDARYWFPCHDAPDSKMSSELRVSVPEGWVALSNGDLLEEPPAHGDSRVFHFGFDSPHPSYLLTLVAGQFSVLEDRPAVLPDGRTIPVTYYVPPGREADGWRSFGITPSIIEHFSQITGIPFPWSRYSQIVVSDFIFGGMENTTATTLYEHALLDERAALDITSADLIAHELAHQWFGDYVTCRDWSEAWLNEGFATFFEHVEREARLGRDEYDWGVLSDLEVYIGECATHYSRPIVSREYQAPIDLFDRHLYQKGGLVLHMLRRELGDDSFWKGVHEYLERNAKGIVETTDLKRAFEKASGHSLDQFFDQWVFQAGHPEIEVKANFERGLLTVSATQKLPEGVAPILWTFEIDVGTSAGNVHRLSKTVTDKQATHVLSLGERPEWVAFDPELRVATPVTLDFPSDFCIATLTKSSSLRARVLAAQALARRTDIPSVTALRQRLVDTKESWMLRAECARCLGKIAMEECLEALASATSIEHPKVRRAVVAALGAFKQAQSFEALRPIAIEDESYLVKAEACRSLGHTRRAEALPILERNLAETSHADIVRAAAFEGLATLRDPAALERIIAGTRYGTPSRGRRAAISALARLGRSRVDREHLEDLLIDRDFFIRTEAARALAKYGNTQSIPALARQLSLEKEARVIREIREALATLSSAGPDQVRQLSDEVRTLQRRIDEMSARLERVTPEPSRLVKKSTPGIAKRNPKKRATPATQKASKSAPARKVKAVRSRNKQR
jgi:aminopeptidase N